MIPIGDSPRARSTPAVTYALILVNVLVFLYELSLSALDVQLFFIDWGVIPRELTDYIDAPAGDTSGPLLRPLTSMFIHGGWLHLSGNMLFLWVFGDNVEDAMGRARYLVFYLAAGYIGAVAQVYADPDSLLPIVGASGAVAGVLGAYLVLYPRATVVAVLPFLLFFPFVVPAALLIVAWFAMQVLNGVASLGSAMGAEGGVAWWAHVGGFAVGLGSAVLMGGPRRNYRRR